MTKKLELKNGKLELKIGEIIKFKENYLIVRESYNCKNCFFYNGGICNPPIYFICDGEYRKDAKDITIEKISEIELLILKKNFNKIKEIKLED